MKRRYFRKHITQQDLQSIQEHIDSSQFSTDLLLGESVAHDCAVVFFDLCNFTNISWSLGRREVFEILQPFFRVVSENVTRHSGMIDKYPGDGVVAFFPNHYDDEDYEIVEAALDSAAEIANWFYATFRDRFRLQKISHSLELSVGVDAGVVEIAHVGSAYHSELILIGDQVNCAGKCQQAAQRREIVIGQEAAARVRTIYSRYFSTGPATSVIYTSSNDRYLSYRFDWQEFAKNSSWLRFP